ncbi:hypothetical protein GCM10027580_21830 [Corynebacterium faecale]
MVGTEHLHVESGDIEGIPALHDVHLEGEDHCEMLRPVDREMGAVFTGPDECIRIRVIRVTMGEQHGICGVERLWGTEIARVNEKTSIIVVNFHTGMDVACDLHGDHCC